MCTFSGDEESTIHIERIFRNNTFWKDQCLPEVESFFKTCLLPELLGNWYTRPNVTHTELDSSSNSETEQGHLDQSPSTSSSSSQSNETSKVYCYCNGPEVGDMIGCDNENCTIEWFHCKCLKISLDAVPKGKWYCPSCRKLPKFNRSKGKTKK